MYPMLKRFVSTAETLCIPYQNRGRITEPEAQYSREIAAPYEKNSGMICPKRCNIKKKTVDFGNAEALNTTLRVVTEAIFEVEIQQLERTI